MYGLITYIRNVLFDKGILKTQRHNIPILSVGNLKAGGTGKTPFVEYLLRTFSSSFNIAVVSRGYGRKTKGFFVVNPEGSAETFGDEPLQMARKFPEVMFVVCEDRNYAIKEIEKRNQELAERNQELEKQNKEIIEAKTVRENYVKNIEGYSLELQKYEEELKGLLIECGFDNLERVKEVLNKKLDVAFLRKKIEHFNWQKQTNAQRLKELSELTFGKQRPSEERLSELKAESKRGSEQLEEILEQKGKIEAEVKTFVQKLEEKQKLQERYGKLEIRLNAMDELLSIFKGDKFVHFISTIYLEQLCAKANERFRIITQNKFEIIYSDKNFEIIDYLNEGKKRSIKTLSGGQMFQASLCMALALVDTIRLSHNSNQDFFFIDEGFGTQDTESLELIFESLKALRGENKTVGLISHNETLKEKISGNISVRFKNNKGSVIETNYL